MQNFYKPGCWNALCDVCGFKFKSDKLMKRWDGLMVCSKDFETRHPSDLIRVPKDNPSIPWSRPVPTDIFVSTPLILVTEDSDGDDMDFAILTELGEPIFTES